MTKPSDSRAWWEQERTGNVLEEITTHFPIPIIAAQASYAALGGILTRIKVFAIHLSVLAGDG
jgi:hypothetical protein